MKPKLCMVIQEKKSSPCWREVWEQHSIPKANHFSSGIPKLWEIFGMNYIGSKFKNHGECMVLLNLIVWNCLLCWVLNHHIATEFSMFPWRFLERRLLPKLPYLRSWLVARLEIRTETFNMQSIGYIKKLQLFGNCSLASWVTILWLDSPLWKPVRVPIK